MPIERTELLPVTPDFSRATLQTNIESILRNSRDIHTHSLTRMIMDAIPRAAPQSESDVVAALQALFDDYKELADSGDAGFWSLEDTPVGKQALAALENARHRITHSLPGDVETPIERTAEQERAAIVAWLRADAQLCDCLAREEGECACGAWDSEPGERSYKRAYIEDIADAIERGDHHSGETNNG